MAIEGNAGGMSPQTQAIIDRLTSEGNLLRNSGTNSIRSVKIELGKFNSVFNAISNNLASQAAIQAAAANTQNTVLEEQRRANDLAELEPPEAKGESKADLLNAQADLLDAKARLKDSKENAKDVGIFGMVKSLLPAMSSIKNIALGGAGLFVAYNFAKGMIDKKTGGKFTEFENSMIKTFQEVEWSSVGSSLVDFAKKVPDALKAITEFLTSPLGAITAGGASIAALLAGPLASGAISGGVRGLLSAPAATTVPAAGAPAPGAKGAMNARQFAMAAAGAGVVYYSSDIADFIKRQAGMSDTEISTMKMDGLVDVGIGAAGGALTLGAIFGPAGIIPGAIVGGALSIAMQTADYLRKSDFDAAREFEDLANEKRQAAQSLQEQIDAGTLPASPELLASIEKDLAGPTAEVIAETNEMLGKNLIETQEELNNLVATRVRDATMINTGRMEFIRDANGNITGQQSIFQDANRSAEDITSRLATRDEQIEETRASLAALQATQANRLQAGLATAESFEYVKPEGIIETFADLWQSSEDRRVARDAAKAKDEERIARVKLRNGITYGNNGGPPIVLNAPTTVNKGGDTMKSDNSSVTVASALGGGGNARTTQRASGMLQ